MSWKNGSSMQINLKEGQKDLLKRKAKKEGYMVRGIIGLILGQICKYNSLNDALAVLKKYAPNEK